MKKLLLSLMVSLFLGVVPAVALAAPAAPTMTHSETGLSITVSWTPVAGATGYTLCYAPYPWQPSMTLADIGYIDMGNVTQVSYYLWEGAAFYLAIQAYDGQGSSNFSNIDYFVMGPPTPQWVDNDGDGYHENSGDCNDSNPAVSPAGVELCGDGIDQDCNGADSSCDPASLDDDQDGYSENQGDCNDNQAGIHPGAVDYCANGIDEDCSGADRVCLPEEIDNDSDGYTEQQGDCNDAVVSIHPQAADVCEDGIDQDCSGADLVCATTAVMPTLEPLGGSFSYGQNVTISSPTPGAQIRYTTDGSEPTLSSALYSGPIPVNSSLTIRALAYKSGMNASPVAAGTYTINPSLTGNWTVVFTMGSNSCFQTSGSTLDLNAGVVQSGNTVTVTTDYGSGSGTLDGNQGSLSTSQPVTYGSISGTLTLTMNITVATSYRSFNGPATFRFSGNSLNCSGSGTIAGTRVIQ